MVFMKLCLTIWLLSSVAALDLYVSSAGGTYNADNQPSDGSTFQSLGDAQNAVRSIISKGMTEDITVHIADGTYYLDSPLNFTTADSGHGGHTVLWKATGSNATISGGMKVTGWTLNKTSGIYRASVPKGTLSRNLYVNGWAAQYARHQLNRTYFKGTNWTYSWNISEYDWLMTTPGIAGAELRSLESFTDHYAPIEAVDSNRTLIMVQDTWQNQVVGWDTFLAPYADFGLFVQNALALLDEGGEYYLDSENGVVYYMPLEGEDMSTAETYLGLLEAIVVICGTYDNPAHDIDFEGINFVC